MPPWYKTWWNSLNCRYVFCIGTQYSIWVFIQREENLSRNAIDVYFNDSRSTLSIYQCRKRGARGARGPEGPLPSLPYQYIAAQLSLFQPGGGQIIPTAGPLLKARFCQKLLMVLSYLQLNEHPRDWLQKFATWLIYQNRHRSKNIWVTRLFFSQNDSLMGESIWPKDSSVTHIFFDLCLFQHFSPVANFGNQSLLLWKI